MNFKLQIANCKLKIISAILTAILLMICGPAWSAPTDYKVTNDGAVHSYDLITKGPWVDARAYGLSTSGTAAANKTALQAAFDAAAAAGYAPVFVPAGAYQINGTIDNKGCPFHGAGSERTKFYMNNAAPAFDITTLGHTNIGDFSISFQPLGQAAIDANCIGLRIKKGDQGRIHNITVWRGYRFLSVVSGVGDGYVWQLQFDHLISAYNKDWAFYIDSASSSTTLKFTDCHVYGMKGYDSFWPSDLKTFKGWYVFEATSVVLSNCSMDGGDGDVHGSVIYILSGYDLFIDTFHLEGFTHTTGGINHTPICSNMKHQNFNHIFLAGYVTDVGAGNIGYVIRGEYPGFTEIGSVSFLSPSTISGTRKIGYITYRGFIRDITLTSADFDFQDESRRFLLTSNIPNVMTRNELTGLYVSVNTDPTTILNVPPRYATRDDSGVFVVHGENGSEGKGFTDIIVLIGAYNGTTLISVVHSGDSGAPPARTYSWDATGKNIQLKLASSSASVICAGTALAAGDL